MKRQKLISDGTISIIEKPNERHWQDSPRYYQTRFRAGAEYGRYIYKVASADGQGAEVGY